MFSMDLSDFGADEDHDKIVNKYKQVSYSQIATVLLIWNSMLTLVEHNLKEMDLISSDRL